MASVANGEPLIMGERKALPPAKPRLAFVVGILLVFGGCGVEVAAENLLIACESEGPGAFPPMTLVYEGGTSGTLTIAGALGEMRLPATREEVEGQQGADSYRVTGIRAFGPTSVLMPDRAALEVCIAGKTQGDLVKDPDLVLMAANACQREVPLGETTVPVTASAEIAIVEPPSAYVHLVLGYAGTSEPIGEQLTIETLPPPQCSVTAP